MALAESPTSDGMSEEQAAIFRACVEAAEALDLEGEAFIEYVYACLCEADVIECD